MSLFCSQVFKTTSNVLNSDVNIVNIALIAFCLLAVTKLAHAMFIRNSQKEARYLSCLSLARFKIAADILMTFAGEFFTEEITDTESL